MMAFGGPRRRPGRPCAAGGKLAVVLANTQVHSFLFLFFW